MRRSLKTKVILSYLVVALITVLVVSVVIRLTSGQSLMNLVVEQQTASLAESVKNYYTSNGSLSGYFDYFIHSVPDNSDNTQPPLAVNRFEFRDIRGVHGLVDTDGVALLPTMGTQVGQHLPQEMLDEAIAVKVDGEAIAYIIPDTKFQFTLSAEEQIFLRRTNLAILMAAGAGVAVALAMGYLLAGGLLKPIKRLTKASENLAQGNLEQQVPVTSQDELGQLTSTFNRMSDDLVKADQQRKRLTADITHDLGTPLTVIAGYVEMLEENKVNLTPNRIEIIKTEIEHLRRLVGDLSTLTQVEAGGLDIQLHPVQPAALLQKIFKIYQPITERYGVKLKLEAEENIPSILVDEGRMIQVIKNLVENALRYTPQGGDIKLTTNSQAGVKIKVQDNGEGIDQEDLPYVFERFYRADKTRGANAGKMGLGLAICKALVNAMGGEIKAFSAGKGQGTSIEIQFDSIQV